MGQPLLLCTFTLAGLRIAGCFQKPAYVCSMNLFSLTAPFPVQGKRQRWRICLLVALFVTLFLLVFQPFGLSTVPRYKVPVIFGYGLVTLLGMWLVYLLLPALFPKVFSEQSWTVGKALLQLMASLLVIATGNLLLSAWLGFFPLTLEQYFRFVGITLAVGIFPGAASFLFAQNVLMRKYLSEAITLNRQLHAPPPFTPANPPKSAVSVPEAAAERKGKEWLVFNDEEGRLALQLAATDLLCLAAADNYTQVYYRQKGELKKELIRNSLKNMEDSLGHSPRFYRCHRSFVLNLGQVQEITGNAQGYKVKLPLIRELVPVSRSR